MRLEKIKLAGFKSFVDPTTVHLPSNLVGVIGPNGCGKSNVIDAVRWVMGESSAKMLRGESMADVIFNGSSSRKPVGAASIELVFDNADGGAGGQYAQYNQISVKRQVTRDGQSSYFLNGVRCRRRDITGLFLGTGLGPRSYSIIEQGMISRVIEARPEELRNFLEEAAGISKYKERRRETENRIRHTRENLDRLNDLREELAKQLQHLERQAATAEKYKQLKQQERQQKAELLALRWRDMQLDLTQRERQIAELETALEKAIAGQRQLESQIEQARESHTESNEHFNNVQGQFYAVGSEIARLEEALAYARNTRKQQQTDLQQLQQAWQEAQQHQQQDQKRLQEIEAQLASETPRQQQVEAEEQQLLERLNAAEQAMQQWQTEWDGFNQQAAEPAQTAQVERTHINHIEQREQQLKRRLERIDEERGRLDTGALDAEIERLEQHEQQLATAVNQQEQALQQSLEQINQARQQQRESSEQLNRLRSDLQSGKGRLSSLEALQQSALGKQAGKQGNKRLQWLRANGLEQARRLAEQIEVQPHWQRAVETVMGFELQAICVDALDQPARQVEQLKSGRLSLLEAGSAPAELSTDALARQIESELPLADLLAGIRTAESLDDALARRAQLAAGESFVTPEGIWVGRNWLRAQRGDDEQAGTLAREQEIRELKSSLQTLTTQIGELEQQHEQHRAQLAQAEQGREQAQRELNRRNRELSDVRNQLTGRRTRVEHLRGRAESLQQETNEVCAQQEKDQQELAAARQKLHQALEKMESHAQLREQLVARRDELRGQLDQLRSEQGKARQASRDLALRLQAMQTSQASLQQNLERMTGQLAHMQRRREELAAGLDESEAPIQQQAEELEAKLAQRLTVEGQLNEARRALGAVEQQLRELEQKRGQAEQGVSAARGKLEHARMARQEVLVRCKTLEEQLKESGFERQSLLDGMEADARVGQWEERVEQMARRITRLGPINLAAIDEFKEQSERMGYLEKQHADVLESLETLEAAIRKIDRETRTRFKETYDHVDSGLKELFPKLFGGGHAYLQLVGEDLLDAGVAVMARPPGKRNASIHLLSGGEKALTAVALVFAIFRLNPAPFCMLDEVDAPLDDANVGRFCELVKEMAEQVQFIFITHNKVTMEIAHQLTGVTMHEPGVSRLVSVDIEEAARMAAV